jgi:hypothetical protein
VVAHVPISAAYFYAVQGESTSVFVPAECVREIQKYYLNYGLVRSATWEVVVYTPLHFTSRSLCLGALLL